MIYETTYVFYLIISITITVWVAKTLSKNGRIFLIEIFDQKTELADSINQMLVVGFYLINCGYITLIMETGTGIVNTRQVFEFLSGKIGFVLIVLGVMHFFLMYVIARWGKAATAKVPMKREFRGDRFE